MEEELGQEQQTNVHNPLRSCSVLSGGAAIVMCLKMLGLRRAQEYIYEHVTQWMKYTRALKHMR